MVQSPEGLSMPGESVASDVNSRVSGADAGESKEGVSGEMVGGSESETLTGNPGDTVGLSDGVRVPEESEIRVEGSVNGGKSVGICNPPGASRSRTAEVISKGWKTHVVMGMVERVLGGKRAVDNEVKDINTARNGMDVSMASDRKVWQGMVGGPPSKYGIDINKPAVDGDSDNPTSWYQGVGDHLNGNQDSVSDVVVPYGKMEIEGFNDRYAEELISKERGEFMTEEEGEFYMSDIVWGKVRSHPWWPGQIIEPSAASNNAKRHKRKKCYLIAYFGDQTFAWNKGSKMKHFQKHFLQMEKQSNADKFVYAVDCALDEVARRVELGLSCQCVPQGMNDRLNSQEVANPDHQQESRRRVGGDSISRAIFFSPEDIMHSLESLAQSPCKINKLQFVVTKSQLLTFNRLHGQYQFPVFENCGRFLEDGSQSNLDGKAKGSVEVMEGLRPGSGSKSSNSFPSRKRKSTAQGSSQKRKRFSGDKKNSRVKEKYLSVLMSASDPSIQNDVKEGIIPSEILAPDGILSDLIFAASNPLRGHKTMKPILGLLCKFRDYVCLEKSTSGSSIQNDVKEGIIPSEILTPDGILSELIFAASNPLWGHRTMKPVLGLLCKFRNFVCLEKTTSGNAVQDSGKLKGKQSANMENLDTFGREGTEDSYWTDRIIQSYSRDPTPFASKNPKEMASGLEANLGAVSNLDNGKEKETVMVDLDPEYPSVPMIEAPEEYFPTALILNFTRLESVPSIANLNEIFRHYGPLEESETKILTKSKRAKVIFKRQQDAETAFSSTGKCNFFGPSLLSYSLNYVSMHRKSHATSKRSKKGSSSEANAV